MQCRNLGLQAYVQALRVARCVDLQLRFCFGLLVSYNHILWQSELETAVTIYLNGVTWVYSMSAIAFLLYICQSSSFHFRALHLVFPVWRGRTRGLLGSENTQPFPSRDPHVWESLKIRKRLTSF